MSYRPEPKKITKASEQYLPQHLSSVDNLLELVTIERSEDDSATLLTPLGDGMDVFIIVELHFDDDREGGGGLLVPVRGVPRCSIIGKDLGINPCLPHILTGTYIQERTPPHIN